MFNHHRGLWGYSGTARDGEPLTVQATGMGGPSAAIVTEELIELGARVLIRIGTCGALTEGLALGELVATEAVLAGDGTSRALGADGLARPDEELTARLPARPVTAVSTDLFYDEREKTQREWVESGASVVEMEAAAVLTVARLRGARAACLLAVSDLALAGSERERASAEEVEKMGLALGEAAWEALALV